MGLPWISHSFPIKTSIFLWFSHGFPPKVSMVKIHGPVLQSWMRLGILHISVTSDATKFGDGFIQPAIKNIHDIPWWSSCGDGRLIGWTPHDFSKSLMHALGWRHLYFSEPCSLFLSLQLRFNGCSWCSSHCAPADVLSSLPLFIRLWDSMSKGSILFTCAMDAMDAMDAMKLDGMNVVTVHPTMADTFLAHVWLSLKTCLRRLCVLESQGAESSSCAIPHKHYLYLSLSIYLARLSFGFFWQSLALKNPSPNVMRAAHLLQGLVPHLNLPRHPSEIETAHPAHSAIL